VAGFEVIGDNCVERPHADDNKVSDKTPSGNAVNEVARSARPNQGRTNERAAAKAHADQRRE
jgi:hypothetical protein